MSEELDLTELVDMDPAEFERRRKEVLEKREARIKGHEIGSLASGGALPIHVISLGAGVQSSTMALMAARGEIAPMPVAAVFADTGDEPKSVYDWLRYLTPLLPFPVVIARKDQSLSEHIYEAIEKSTRVSKPPLFTSPEPYMGIFCANCQCEHGTDRYPCEECGCEKFERRLVQPHAEGFLTRDCTRDFKVSVIQRAVREVMKQHRARQVVQWIGISLDEAIRMKPSRVKYSEHRWPLIDLRMSRHDCLLWMERNGFPRPPRSACVYCPHHSNQEWRRLRDEEPEAWLRAVEFDKKIRTGINKVRAKCYVHRSCVPLDQVDLSTDGERGQGLLWGNECEGMCGV